MNQKNQLMPKKEFIRRFAVKLGVTQSITEQIIDVLEETVIEGIHEYGRVKVGDLAYFQKKSVPQKTYYLPGDDTPHLHEAYEKVVATTCEKNRILRSLEELYELE